MEEDTPTTTSTRTRQLAIAYAYKWEGHSLPDPAWRSALGEALAHKYWLKHNDLGDENGFLNLVGSMQTVRCRISQHYGQQFFCNDATYQPLQGRVGSDGLSADSDWIQGYGAAANIWGKYSNQDAKDPSWQNRLFDFGNPMPDDSAELTKAVQDCDQGLCPKQLYYVSNTKPASDRAYVMTFTQAKCLKGTKDPNFCSSRVQGCNK